MKNLLFMCLIIANFCACVKSNNTQNDPIGETINTSDVKQINSSEDFNLQKSSDEKVANASEVKYINSPEGLNLREFSKIDSKVITTIPNGSMVELLSINSDSVVIDGIKDYWHFVNYGNITGWVFGGYLTSTAPQKENIDEDMAKRAIIEEKINNPHDKFPQSEAGVILANGDKWFIGQAVDDNFISKSNTVVETRMFLKSFGPINGFEDENVKVAWNNQKRILYIEVLSPTVKTYSGLTLGSTKTDVMDTLGIPHIETSNTLRYDNFWDDIWGIIFQFENGVAIKVVLFCYT
ncbi:hypothetical protein FACS1894109_10550 [Spirochaetia bacterium]|nr:hypothetical protein FACS1894109_10550 [Spirochaetia bacterium]